MPLPENDTAWPPPAHATPLAHMAEWSAWYSGDPGELSAYYSGANRGTGRVRPAQRSSGVVGRVARWWWGQPTPHGEQSAKLHVPLAADICGTSADLLFSEPVKFHTESDSLGEFLTGLQDDGMDAELHQGAEVAAALGGGYLRVVWDRDLGKRPWTDTVHADMALPEFKWGRLAAVTFWQRLAARQDERLVYRLMERHAPGFIEHALYRGTADNVGRRVPLEDHPDAADLAGLVNAEGVQETGTQRLTATYVPNMLPNRALRGSPQGRSDLQGVTPFLDALDEAYSSWWRDIRHAKARLHVPAQYLETSGPGSAGRVDLDREVYVPVDGVLGKSTDGLAIHAQQFLIRVQEHADTCKAWTERIIESAGYSTQSLSSSAGGAVTAAEVHSHERRSYMTRGKKVRYWKAALREHAQALAEVANYHLSAGVRLDDTLTVGFQDGVQESAQSLAQTAQTLRGAEAASTETVVRLVHPDWSEPDVTDEVERILRERGTPDPLGLGEDAGL